MKKIAILSLAAILNLCCNAQEQKRTEDKPRNNKDVTQDTEKPKGTWRVDKEFDENGNMIRYDSVYSWSSENMNELAQTNPDSLLQSFQSRFYSNFSRMDRTGFEDMFSPDSLFSKRFFNNDFFTSEFGEDFMDIDKMHDRMENMQQHFLEKYQSEFRKIENDSSEKKN